ncbi:MAG: hypothetical protein OEZ36_02215 [Spirochaetota bacterium]|nr:hypothetical protein [Spirochaetota bacterium]
MNDQHENAINHFTQGISRIADFWGLPKALGSIYAKIYLSPHPISLDELVIQANISKGAVSTNVRSLERLGMIHKQFKLGDRKDYYIAEPDFWKIIRGILREREKKEFDLALNTVSESLDMLKDSEDPHENIVFLTDRMKEMQSFFSTIDRLVATVIALDDLGLTAITKLFGKKKKGKK